MKTELGLALVLVGCGAQQKQQEQLQQDVVITPAASTMSDKKTVAGEVKTTEFKAENISLAINSMSELHGCTEEIANQLVYILDSNKFFACIDSNWVSVNVQGEKGEQGIAGRDGADGQDGAQGIQGVQGIQGLQGVAGNNGSDASMPDLVTDDGQFLGKFVYVNTTVPNVVAKYNSYLISFKNVTNVGYNIEEKTTVYYESTDCTGKRALQRSMTADTYRLTTGEIVHVTFNSFNAQSVRSLTTNACDVLPQPSSLYEIETVTGLPFNLPVPYVFVTAQ